MNNYVIMTDTNTELPLSYYKEHKVPVFRMPYTIDGEEKLFDLGENTDFVDFYTRVKNGSKVSTATRSPEDIKDFYRELLETGKDILYVCFSSALSGHQGLAFMAKNEILEEYPERRIEIVDTLSISLGAGLLVMHAVNRMEQGMSMDDVIAWLEANKLRALHYFSVDDLMYLKRQGRLSGATAMLGTALNLKPILKCDRNGKIISFDKVKGSKKIQKYFLNIIEENYDEADDVVTEMIGIVHANNLEAAKAFKQSIEENYNFKKIILQDVGPVIGSHTGPGVLAMLMIGKEENR